MKLKQVKEHFAPLVGVLRQMGKELAPDIGIRVTREGDDEFYVMMHLGRRSRLLLDLSWEDPGWSIFDYRSSPLVMPPQTFVKLMQKPDVLRHGVGVVYAMLVLKVSTSGFLFPMSAQCRAVTRLVAVPRQCLEEP